MVFHLLLSFYYNIQVKTTEVKRKSRNYFPAMSPVGDRVPDCGYSGETIVLSNNFLAGCGYIKLDDTRNGDPGYRPYWSCLLI